MDCHIIEMRFTSGSYYSSPFRLAFPRRKRGKAISPLQLCARLAEENPPYVLDVRDLGEFTGELGHIEGAHLMPVSDLDKRVNELAACRSQTVVLV